MIVAAIIGIAELPSEIDIISVKARNEILRHSIKTPPRTRSIVQ